VRRVLALLDAEPLRAGYEHPAEALVRNRWVAADVFAAALEPDRDPGERADLLRLLVRVGLPRARRTREMLLRSALTADSVDLVDAGIGAVEQWGDPALVPLLALAEPVRRRVRWLDEYARGVARDLGGEEE